MSEIEKELDELKERLAELEAKVKPGPVKPAPAFEEHDLYIYDDARPLPAKPEPGDVVWYDGDIFEWNGDTVCVLNPIVLMRAADVRSAIGEGIRKGIEAKHETH